MAVKSQFSLSREAFDVMLTVVGSLLPDGHILPKNQDWEWVLGTIGDALIGSSGHHLRYSLRMDGIWILLLMHCSGDLVPLTVAFETTTTKPLSPKQVGVG